MRVDKNIGIGVNDGTVLRANVYRPDGESRYPVLMSMGIYGKDVHFADAYGAQWDKLLALNPHVCADGSSGRYLRWEMIDPERWTAFGYAVVAIDSRGSGQSPGYLDPFSARETQDFYDCIEWAAAQAWSTGRVGLIGISYLAIKQWQVAALQPPSLAAICPWEGGCDLYRDWSHHGGILSNAFPTAWWPRQVLPNQHGNANTSHRDRDSGAQTTGRPLPAPILRCSRADHPRDLLEHPLRDAWYAERTPDLTRIEVPVLSAGNWGGAGLHLRGNIEGFVRARSHYKWLEMHSGTHFESFYAAPYIARQRAFFDCFLKEETNGWANEPRVRLEIRRPEGPSEMRTAGEWPLPDTQWTKYHLVASTRSLSLRAPEDVSSASYDAGRARIDFVTDPFTEETEFTGPVAARLWMSSSTIDLDLFVSIRMLDPANEEVVFTGASDFTPVARGWLRASHRKRDEEMSRPYRPFLSHEEVEPLEPGKTYPLDVEIWPTSIVFPAGYRMKLTIGGTDLELGGVPGRILHNDPQDRPDSIYGGDNKIVTGPRQDSYIIMPRIERGEGRVAEGNQSKTAAPLLGGSS
jgi:predicted acyl esterase